MNDAAETPQVRGLVVLLLDEAYFRRPVPAAADMQRDGSFHRAPPLTISLELCSEVFNAVLRILHHRVRLLAQEKGVYEAWLAFDFGSRVSHRVRPIAKRFWHRAREAEIAERHTTVLVNEKIGRLQVSMHDIAHMTEGEAAQCIVEQLRHVQLVQVHLAFKHAVQIRLNVVEHDANVHQVALITPLVDWADEVHQLGKEHVSFFVVALDLSADVTEPSEDHDLAQ